MFVKTVVLLLLLGVNISIGFFNTERNLFKTWKNSTFYAFRGIKYAEAPIGSLRFKAPSPAKTWSNITAISEQRLDTDGSDCPSPNQSYKEDCLYLNVYTKNLDKSQPVIVFIHPGGFYIGSGSSSNHGPEYLLEEDLVLVTFNYRLAFFGFTSIGSSDAIGNAGFKDQALVLKWVHDHIHNFGGDPNCVTLVGDSAGAMSVQLHLVSPLSRHLFHRAFLMSGGVLPQAPSPSSQPQLIMKLANLIGCSKNQNPFDCIKKADTQSITNSLRKIFDFGWDNPVYPWLPIVEPKTGDEAPFLDKDPIESLEIGSFNAMPIMVSITKDETSMSAMYLFEHRELLAEYIRDFSRIAPICMQYDANETITQAMKERYVPYALNDREHFVDLFSQIAKSFSDSTITFPLYRFAQIVKRFSDVYFLQFNYHGKYSGFKCDSSIDETLCDEINALNIVQHLDDLQYLFTSANIPKVTDPTSDEGQIVQKFTKLLYSFAKNGYPDFGSEFSATKAKFNDDETFVKFNATFELNKHPFKDATLWDSLFPMKN